MARQLPPWFENLGKRQVKAPKVYVRDTGLLHALLGIANQRDLEHHPKLDEVRVVYPGAKRYTLAEKVEVLPLAELVNAR